MEEFISISEAATLSQRSTQTIRRLIKVKKLKFRRSMTPQGFSYIVDKESLLQYIREEAQASLILETKPPVEEIFSGRDEDPRVYEIHENPSSFRLFHHHNLLATEATAQRFPDSGLKQVPAEEERFEGKSKTPRQIDTPPLQYPQESETGVADNSASSAQSTTVQKADQTQSDYAAFFQNQQGLFQQFNQTVQNLIAQHESVLKAYEEDKRNLFHLAEKFQERIINLENQIRQLEAPKMKWYQFWK